MKLGTEYTMYKCLFLIVTEAICLLNQTRICAKNQPVLSHKGKFLTQGKLQGPWWGPNFLLTGKLLHATTPLKKMSLKE